MNAELKSLREQMSQKKKEGQPVFELDTEVCLHRYYFSLSIN